MSLQLSLHILLILFTTAEAGKFTITFPTTGNSVTGCTRKELENILQVAFNPLFEKSEVAEEFEKLKQSMVHIPGVTQLLDREDELTLLEESELFDNVIDHMGQFLINVLEGVDVQFTYEKNCICKSSCYKKDNAYMQLICLAQPVDTFCN